VAFRIQDLMTDVFPTWQMANPRCTCQISAEIQGEPALPGDEPENVPNEELDCHETLLPSGDCPGEEEELLAANLMALRSELRRALHAS
jgi:hypothetical protein